MLLLRYCYTPVSNAAVDIAVATFATPAVYTIGIVVNKAVFAVDYAVLCNGDVIHTYIHIDPNIVRLYHHRS